MDLSKKEQNLIIRYLRRSTLVRRGAVLKRQRVRIKVGKFKNGKDKFEVFYWCAHCGELIKDKVMDVDHIIEVGPYGGNWHDFMAKLWCDIMDLQGLCKPCHLIKTNLFRDHLRSGGYWL